MGLDQSSNIQWIKNSIEDIKNIINNKEWEGLGSTNATSLGLWTSSYKWKIDSFSK